MTRKDIIKRSKNEVIYEAQIEGIRKHPSKESIIGISAIIVLILFIILTLLFS